MKGSTSIHDLPPEMLYLVFKANANMEDHPQTLFDSNAPTALGDTLSTSHVCKLWRELILGSPSLWGGLVDVDYLMCLSPVGRDEVVRRTGGALLSIRGFVSSAESYDFVITLLLETWKRVEHLCLIIPNNTFSDPSKSGWEPLYWSATNLRSFSFGVYMGRQRVNPVLFEPGLFNNDAPRLQVFESPCLPDPLDLAISGSPSPFAQIHRLCLQEVACDWIPFRSLLDALKIMQRLESLSLTSTSRERPIIATTFPVVRLPSLLNLKLTFTPILWATILLESLVPDRGCGLQLMWGNPPVIKDATDKKHFNDVLTRYATNAFCNNSTCDRLRVSFTPNLLQIKQHSITMAPHLSDLDHPPGISLSFLRSSKSYTSILSETFLLSTIFSSCDFTGIKTLELTLKRGHPTKPLTSAANINSDHAQEFLLTSFPNVKYLKTDIKTLHVLASGNDHIDHINVRSPPRIIFPKLDCVGVDHLVTADRAWSVLSDAPIESICTRFFDARSRAGFPVRTFDLSKCDKLVPLAALDGVVGLRVAWTSYSGDMDEYRCGDGDPERLVNWTYSAVQRCGAGCVEST